MNRASPRDAGEAPDFLLLAAAIALLVLGTLMVYSSSFVIAHNEFNDDLYFLTRHIGSIALGAVAMLGLAKLDYRRWRGVSLLVMLACIALLLLVLTPGIGTRSYGAVRWIRMGPVGIQPSEIAKIAVALYLADWLARRGSRVQHFGNGSIPFAIIVGAVAGLVEMQPDLGTTIIIVGTAACVFFIAGANLLHVALMSVIGVLGGLLMIVRMAGYRQDRIAAFLDPWADVQGAGWHTAQTLISLGSGGLFGVGLGGSRHKFYWVPNAHTDAIFAIIGEELGFLGTVGVLALFGVVAWRGFLIAWRAPDPFGRLFAAGLTSALTLQAIVNVAVITNSIPYTGVPLPFISYGGSSTVVSMAAVGLLLGISRYRRSASVQEPAAEQGSPVFASQLAGARRSVGALVRASVLPSLLRERAKPSNSPRLPESASMSRAAPEPPGYGSQARPSRRRTLRTQPSSSGRARGHSGRGHG